MAFGHWLLQLDHTITFFFYRSGAFNPTVQKLLFQLSEYFVYLLPLILLYLFWRGGQDRVNSAKIFLAAIIPWVIFTTLLGGYLFSHFGFRERPFASLGIQELFLKRPDKAFPSDHATVLMAATLAFFAYRYKGLGWLFLVGGVILSSLARVAVGFHWFGDILGGFVSGALGVWLIWAFDRPLNVWLTRLLVWNRDGN
ncbi:MAG TPA: phosphatase PAP2 family protein [Candidatus Saccharimonadales bacterium]|nr:phosphatase PAP2 family protein [Candidatus Saccharimonadales bacterium]